MEAETAAIATLGEWMRAVMRSGRNSSARLSADNLGLAAADDGVQVLGAPGMLRLRLGFPGHGIGGPGGRQAERDGH